MGALTDSGIFASYVEDHDGRHYYRHNVNKTCR